MRRAAQLGVGTSGLLMDQARAGQENSFKEVRRLQFFNTGPGD